MSRRNKKKQQQRREAALMKQFMENADQMANTVNAAMENMKLSMNHISDRLAEAREIAEKEGLPIKPTVMK